MIKISNANTGYISKLNQNKNNNTVSKNLLKTNSTKIQTPTQKKLLNYKNIMLGAGILFGALLVLYKAKPLIKIQGNKILKNTEKLKEEASVILKKGDEEFNTVRSILYESKKNNFQDVTDESGNIIRKFIKGNDIGLMQDFNGDKITREVEFDPKDLIFEEIFNNVEHFEDGSKEAENVFFYGAYGEVESFIKKFTITAKGNEKSVGMFVFENDKLLSYSEECILSPKAGTDTKNSVWLDNNGKVISYTKRYLRDFENNEYSTGVFEFDEKGRVTHYQK